MKKLLLTVSLVLFSVPAFADMVLKNVRAYETAPGMKNGAVVLTIQNTGKDWDKLIGASTPAADRVEIHEMTEEKGVMKMREVGAVKIEAGKSVELSPTGYHVMLFGLKEPLKSGTAHPLTLEFLKAGKMKTTFEVKSRAEPKSMPSMPGMDHMDMSHPGD